MMKFLLFHFYWPLPTGQPRIAPALHLIGGLHTLPEMSATGIPWSKAATGPRCG